MPRTCTIRRHQKRQDVETALIDQRPFRRIAEQFRVSASALVRHCDDHIPVALARAEEAAEVACAGDPLAQVTSHGDGHA